MSLVPEVPKPKFDWGIAASLSAHAIVLALLIFGLPQRHHEPAEPQAITVDIVSPEKPEKSQEKKGEEAKKAEAQKQQEQKQAQKPPEPKAEEQKQEAKKQEPRPAEPEQPPEPEQEKEQRRLKALRPVVRFAEKDAGPSGSTDDTAGAETQPEPSAGAQATPPAEEPVPPAEAQADQPAGEPAPQPDQPQPETQETLASEAVPLPEIPDPAAVPVPEPAPKPPAARAAQNPQRDAQTPPRTASSRPRPAGADGQRTAQGLPGTRFQSRSTTDEPLSTTAMSTLPRGLRAGELCATALRQRLRNSMPPYWPDLLPAYRLDKGNVLQVRKGAFRSEDQWYNLSFRCEVDEAATRVVSFAFDVGAPIPESEWRRRGFPSF